jgi:hypothetical protein
MAASTASRGWAACLAILSHMVFQALPKPDLDQESGKESASALRVLLDEVLPVVTHATSHRCCASSSSQKTDDTPSQHALLQDSTCQPGVASDTLPVESTLLLLGASARLLRFCVTLAAVNKDAYSTLSRSPHPATRTPHQDDLVAALDAVLALASDLVSGGPWWQEARARHPLALVDALYDTSVVRENYCMPGYT